MLGLTAQPTLANMETHLIYTLDAPYELGLCWVFNLNMFYWRPGEDSNLRPAP